MRVYNEEEVWKDIPGYEDLYQVSNLGNVMSLKYKGHDIKKLLKIKTTRNGYKFIIINNNKIKKSFYVHQLVCMAFLNHKPNGINLVCDHINSDITDNRLINLRIVTHRKNCSIEKTIKRDFPVGVSLYDYLKVKKYRASISIRGKQKILGNFKTPEEASEAYQEVLSKIKQDEL
jgi:hypothetical protein